MTIFLVLGKDTVLVLFLESDDFLLRFGENFVFFLRNVHIEYAGGDSADSRILKAEGFDIVEDFAGFGRSMLFERAVDDVLKLLFADAVLDF